VILAAHESLTAEHGGGAGLRNLGLLESALARPQNLHAYTSAISLPELAAAYGIAIVQNHPFIDGNKRAGLVALQLFLDLNGFQLNANDAQCVEAILGLAAGELSDPDFVAWVTKHSRPTSA